MSELFFRYKWRYIVYNCCLSMCTRNNDNYSLYIYLNVREILSKILEAKINVKVGMWKSWLNLIYWIRSKHFRIKWRVKWIEYDNEVGFALFFLLNLIILNSLLTWYITSTGTFMYQLLFRTLKSTLQKCRI